MKYIVADSTKRKIKSFPQKKPRISENFAETSGFDIDTMVEEFSEEIPRSEAQAMIANFRKSNPNDIPSYSIPSVAYMSFLNKVKPVSANGRTKAVGVSPGRTTPTGLLNFSLETIKYDIVQPGQGKNPNPLTGASFFGKLASQFNTDFTSANRPVMDAAVREKEIPGTEMILIEFTALYKFSNVNFDQLVVEFARTAASRLTIVLSRLQNGVILQTGTGELGLFLDDHDLIP